MDEVKHEAERRGINLVILPAAKAIEALRNGPADINAILHVTCRRTLREVIRVAARILEREEATNFVCADGK